MKKSLVLLPLLAAVLVGLVFTGFQCGSPALTSAKLYIQRQEWVSAENSLMSEVQKNPANAEAWYLLGDVRRNMGNFQGMMEAFDQSLKASPEFAEKIGDVKHFVWGSAMKRAIASYNQSINAQKDSAVALRDSAITYYKIAVLVMPDSIIGFQNLAIAYHVNGDYDGEIATLKSALAQKKDIEISKTLIDANISKAERAKQNGNKEEAANSYSDAIAALTEARATAPDDPELLETLINLYISADRTKEAIPFLQEAVTKDPKNKEFQHDLGLLMLQDNKYDEATQHLEAAIAIDPGYEDGLWDATVAYLKWGDKLRSDAAPNSDSGPYLEKFKSAVKLAQKLVEIKKDVIKYWDGLGRAYANAGMSKEAQKAFEQVETLKKK